MSLLFQRFLPEVSPSLNPDCSLSAVIFLPSQQHTGSAMIGAFHDCKPSARYRGAEIVACWFSAHAKIVPSAYWTSDGQICRAGGA